LAPGAWDHAAKARGAAVAGGRDQPVNSWYRRKAKARQEAALAFESVRRRTVLARAEAFVADLQRELAEAARCHAIMAGIIGEMAALQPPGTRQLRE